MVDDQEFFDFMKHLLRRVHALEIRTGAIQIALAENYHPDFAQRMTAVEQELKSHPVFQEMDAAIDALGLEELLAMLAKHNGPVQ